MRELPLQGPPDVGGGGGRGPAGGDPHRQPSPADHGGEEKGAVLPAVRHVYRDGVLPAQLGHGAVQHPVVCGGHRQGDPLQQLRDEGLPQQLRPGQLLQLGDKAGAHTSTRGP